MRRFGEAVWNFPSGSTPRTARANRPYENSLPHIGMDVCGSWVFVTMDADSPASPSGYNTRLACADTPSLERDTGLLATRKPAVSLLSWNHLLSNILDMLLNLFSSSRAHVFAQELPTMTSCLAQRCGVEDTNQVLGLTACIAL